MLLSPTDLVFGSTPTVLGKGSMGSEVLAGVLNGADVAVKKVPIGQPKERDAAFAELKAMQVCFVCFSACLWCEKKKKKERKKARFV